MKTEIGEAMLRRRLRISLLSPLVYAAGAGISFRFPNVATGLYAAIPAYFALVNPASGRRETGEG